LATSGDHNLAVDSRPRAGWWNRCRDGLPLLPDTDPEDVSTTITAELAGPNRHYLRG
jgi:hypothetical protein